MSVTVVIPCHKRHQYLGTVLNSIKQQTALSSIDKIIVSENSNDDRSKSICDQFPELNITYYQQPVEMTAVEHNHWLINQSTSDYTAMLHDDDWWYPTHLENALQALSENSTAAYFSNFVFAKNEILKGAFFHHPSIISHFVNPPLNINYACLGFKEVATICYLFTPFHMSTLVAKTSFFQYANNEGLKYAKPWYADRILYPYLAVNGDIVFNPQVLCGIREHDGNDAKTINFENRHAWHAEGSMKIRSLAESHQVNVINVWKDIHSAIAKPDWHNVTSIFHAHFGDKNNEMFIELPDNKKPVTIKRLVKQILPYGLVKK